MEIDKTTNRTMRRMAILLQLQAAYPASLSETAIGQGFSISGRTISEQELKSELSYLCEKSFVAKIPSKISAGFFRYKLTSQGVEFLESEGF